MPISIIIACLLELMLSILLHTLIHLKNIANQISDAFTDSRKIIKAYILIKNALASVEILKG